MIEISSPNLCGNEKKYLNECVESNFVSSVGPFVDKFEKIVAKETGAKYCVATSSGTTGLHAALTAIGVKPGDLVIVPSFTFIASANSIAHCGAIPLLFDIDNENWTINPDLLKNYLEKQTAIRSGMVFDKKTGKIVRAIMPVYTLGNPADMDAIMSIAKKYELTVIADAAPAIGARYKGKSIGELADLSVISFNGNKTVTAGGGGAVIGSDEELLRLVRHLTTTARVGTDYDHDRVGFNYRMTNLQAAVGLAQMENLESFVKIKRRIRDVYDHAFKDLPQVGLFPRPSWIQSACWFSGITIDQSSTNIDKMIHFFKMDGVNARRFWKPVHFQKPYFDSPKMEMTVTGTIWNKILIFPCSTHLSPFKQQIVIDIVKKVIK